MTRPIHVILEGSFERELSDDSVPLIPGQQVVWLYRPQRLRRKAYPVAAEAVQVSSLRVRIRVCTGTGKTMLRWVHPKNIHARSPDEPASLYPEPS